MKFAAMIEYIPDAAKIDSIRPTHRQYLTDLLAKGQLAACGPFTDGWGALIVYEADTAEQAEALLKADPFHDAGIFVRWTIRPWKVVMAQKDMVG